MAYRLLLSQLADSATRDRDVGEDIFLQDLPTDYKVYLFYFSGAMPDEDLEKRLRQFGQMTGKNLLVNIAGMRDPDYMKISKSFGIKVFPVIIMTAVDGLASSPDPPFTAFVRMDSPSLLGRADLTIQCVQKLFNLFLQGQIAEAMNQFRRDNRAAVIASLKSFMHETLKGLTDFLKGWEVNISFIEGKLELKYEGR